MLYLLEGNEFKPELNSFGKQKNVVANFSMSKIIYEKLKLASETNELIHTQWLRGVGKTFELVQFAKVHGYAVLHPQADIIKEKYRYENIYKPNINMLRGCKINGDSFISNVVIDEGVTNIQELKDAGFKIITGFYTSKKDNEKSFDETIIDNLKNELESLTTKIQKTRENHDFGTYKNLVLAYKEVLGLYKECVNNKQDILNYHVHIDKVISNTEDLGRQIGESLKSIKNNI